MSNDLKEYKADTNTLQSIPHHSMKEIFDGIHEKMVEINYALQHFVIYDEISDKDINQICESIKTMRSLLIELECDYCY